MARMASVPALRFMSMRRTSSCSMIRTRSARPVGKGRALDPFLGVLQRRIIGGCRQTQGLEPAAHAGLVHHLKHLGHAAVGFAQQNAAALPALPKLREAVEEP